jgi:putative tryptophan/tyrosine transport system substrate-binding protein
MTLGIGRRKFISALGGTAVAWPLAARAQQAAMPPTIGFLSGGGPSQNGEWIAAFVQRLRELGWIEGRTVAIEYRWAEGRPEQYAQIAAEFVRLRVDVIVTTGLGAQAAKQLTSVIPIVFPLSGDPVATGLVASLARPGGNVTGLSMQQTDTTGKRLELLREVVPGLRQLAILGNVGNSRVVLEMGEAETAARALGIEVVQLEIRRTEDIAAAFAAHAGGVKALYVAYDPLENTNKALIINLALGARLPTMVSDHEFVEAGGLMSYGPSSTEAFRRTAEIVDKILRGTKPADIPVEQPTKFDLIINLKTAKALGLDISATLLARADEVIE